MLHASSSELRELFVSQSSDHRSLSRSSKGAETTSSLPISLLLTLVSSQTNVPGEGDR